MQRSSVLTIGLVFLGLLVATVSGMELKLTDGTVIQGEPASFSDGGLVIRRDVGGFTERIPWIRFTQETLKELVKDQKNAEFVEPFIDLPPEVVAKQKEIRLNPVPRVERVGREAGFFAALSTPIGLVILLALYAANLLAAYEVAVFRNRPVGLVCGVSLVLPAVGPLLFMSLPSAPAEGEYAEAVALGAAGAGAGEAASATSKVKSKLTGLFGKKEGGLTLAAMEKPSAAAGPPQTKTFAKGAFTLNRRFFETQFPGFFRVVPSEAEKDLVLAIRAGRTEYVGKRITRITMNELHLQLLSGGEVAVAFADMQQVQLRHKDAKA
jgi:hypothetical protein